ncbi:Maf family protein [Leekyejoonella antrihumi]|uniref:Maf family protein n=1 Tax=Leekyejoonella antrihumi TaxID=1660198 RepID=UPI001FEB62FC|nr:Maf family protein [Leekyejoonella antrihumi]
MQLILASASPARLKTLRSAGIEPRVVVSHVDEPAVTAEAQQQFGRLEPVDVPLLLARAKCEAVAAQIGDADALVLGCDSVLEIDGAVHGKPTDPQDAIERWARMRGRSGTLHTGHWLIDARADGTGATFGVVGSTLVQFADIDDDEIRDYVSTGEPLYVAGAFTVDGLGGPYITGIQGDYHNVVGLSLPVLREMLAEVGVPWRTIRAASGLG